jgi:hypothetical protein
VITVIVVGYSLTNDRVAFERGVPDDALLLALKLSGAPAGRGWHGVT